MRFRRSLGSRVLVVKWQHMLLVLAAGFAQGDDIEMLHQYRNTLGPMIG